MSVQVIKNGVKTDDTKKKEPVNVTNVSEQYFGNSNSKVDGADDHFRLDIGFINQYKNKSPKFGFNGLGELVFFRTYSRIKSDGSKETFLDTLVRVVEGCYEIQRQHCKRLHIPWDYQKALTSAHEMFVRMWNFKFLPPGRGLWMMGTPFMWTRGSAALNNCFRGDTEIITREGVKTIGSLVGTTQELLTTDGKWVKAPIKSFGKQELYKLTLERSGVTKVIYTTADHRWFARDRRFKEAIASNTMLNNVDGDVAVQTRTRSSAYQEFTTVELRPGVHRLRYIFGQGIQGNVRPSPFGVAHGIAYGDGTTGSDSESCGTYLYLCGKKNEELLEYFPNSPTSFDSSKGNEGAVRVADLPRFFRRPPSMRESKNYLYGWLAGYFAADGKINKKGNCVKISSSKYEDMALVRDVCCVLGIGTYSISQSVHTVNHKGNLKKFVGYEIGLMTSHLKADFFLLSEHRSRFEKHTSYRNRPVYGWKVVSVESTGEVDEVYCPEVPNTNAFALADNILTGNCGFVSTHDLMESDPAEPFCFLMDMSMLGVGVGFDTKGAGRININKPFNHKKIYKIADSREGWVDSVRQLIWAYTIKSSEGEIEFDYSAIRKSGETINGFGGKASGPGILMELHKLIKQHLDGKVGKSLDSVDITDLMNYIGRCVVAGNVRRCLPKGTLVHLKRGLVPIEQVVVGDLVLTTDGYHTVAENVKQGVQRVVTINSQLGAFRCTDRHRVAVMTGIGEYEWKRAFQLKTDDRLVFVDAVIPGTETVLPGYRTSDESFVVPSLTPDVSWFIGAIHGDGYVYNGRKYKGHNHHGASVMIPINKDEYHDALMDKVNAGFAAFGYENIKIQPSDDNSVKYRVVSRKLAEYLHANVKQSKVPLNVPEFIRMAKPAIRAAYVAGLMDTDGSTKNRPTTLLASVYRDFVRQVQAVYSSLGIPTKMELRAVATDKAQAEWVLSLVGDFAIGRFIDLIQPYAVKKIHPMEPANGYDFGYPSEWVKEDVNHGRSWSPQQKQMTYNRALLCEVVTSNLVPVRVESVVDEGIEVETFDLSVPDRNEFVAEGLLVHNTAEIAFGDADDLNYASMKNYKKTLLAEEVAKFEEVTGNLWAQALKVSKDACPQAKLEDFANTGIPQDRLVKAIETWNAMNHHRWASNNSIFANVGMDYKDISEQIAVNGEPGLIWLSNMRDYGRLADGRQPGIDGRVMGSNPCVEQSLESYELCNLVETFPANHDDAEDYMRTLKFAYLYAKTVTLLPTHNPRTNQVTLRNRRIGLSQSGIIQAFAKFGRRAVLKDFCDAGYNEIRRWDKIYSEWLCIQNSIKVTSVKPSGTVSLVAGATPGIHHPEAATYWRRVRIAKDSVLVKILTDAGYHVEPAISDPDRTVVVKFAVNDERVRPVEDTTIWEQMANAADYQRYWADNQVSCTVKFKYSERAEICRVLEAYEDQIKGISFLPHMGHGYAQAPYEPCTAQEVIEYNAKIKPADYSSYIMEAVGSSYCDNDSCALPTG